MSWEGLKSDFANRTKPAETLEIAPSRIGHSYPQRCPQPEGGNPTHSDPLGDAMGIAEVAEMLGCSAWTIRQRYMPQGLPYLRASETGRLVFFRNQVTRWIIQRQQKGER